MARHNREGHGADQCGYGYGISYQPDWLRHIKVTRNLESGRQSTKTLFRNPANRRQASPGDRIRTRVVSWDQGLDFEIAVGDPHGLVKRVRVAYSVPSEDGSVVEEVEFTLENKLPPINR